MHGKARPDKNLDFLSGGGDMGARMRAHDWAATPLGPPEAWPQSLRSALGICLNSSFPTAIYWGPELRLFYNDAWAPIPAERHPTALGRPAREVWADIWDIIKPQFGQVVATGEGFSAFDQMLPMERAGRARKTYWTYSFTPIRGEDGAVAGVFNQGNETTPTVLAARRSRLLLDLADRLRDLGTANAIMEAAARAIGEHLEADRVGYADIDEAEGTAVHSSDWTAEGVKSAVGRHRLADFGDAFVAELRAGRIVVIDDVASDPRTARASAAFVLVGVGALIVAPVIRSGRWVAALFVHMTEPRLWAEAEGELVREAAERTWAAIERVRAEAALREREERLRLIVEAAHDYAIITIDPARRVTGWSMGAEKAFGWTAEDIIGRTADAIFTPEDRAAGVPERETETAAGEGCAKDERWHQRADGGRVFMNGTVQRLPVDETGRERGFIKIARDETEQRAQAEALTEARAVLVESEERFRNLADHAPVMMWVTDASGVCTYLNRLWYEFTGQSAAEAEGFGWLDATHPDDKAASERVFLEANAQRTPFRLEYRLRRADGVYRWAIDAASPRFGPAGEFLGYVGSVIDIDERREIEDRLRESEDRLRLAAEAADIGTWDFDPVTGALQWDRRCKELFGLPPSAEVDYDTFLAGLHPDDRATTDEAVQLALAPDGPGEYDIDYRTIGLEDGVERWIAAKGRAFFRNGRAERFVGTVMDVTERRRIEAALRGSEAKFEAIANSIDQLIWSTRPDGYHDYYNQRWYEYTGVPAGSTDGEAWNGMFHPDDQERAWAVWRRSLETGEPYHIEYRLRHRTGHYRLVLGRAQPVRDDDGRIMRWFGTCTDIHDLKIAEEERARAVARLRDLNETLERRVAERTADRDRMWRLSTDIMLVARFDGTIMAVNPAWSSLLGWSEEELIGRSFLGLVHPDDLLATQGEAGRLSDGQTTLRFRNRYRHKDGSYRCLSWTAVPDAGLIHAVGRDITEENERAEALRVTEEALRQAQKMEAIGQLTGGVAHDFNNLLTIIRSSSDLLRRPDLPDERRRRYVDAIADTVDRASKLTGQLLAFARRQALKPEVFDVTERVRATSDMLRTIVGARITIAADIACGRCFAEADVAQFETALVNMAVNARDAMDGEGTLIVRVESLSEMPPVRGHGGGRGPFVAVSIADTGSGIPADKLPHIFEPFFTTKEVGKGTGLGLSQVYGFAKQSGGDVAVASEVGRGATFTLYLPRVEREPEEDDAGAESEGPAELGRGRRVLVVEDNVDVGKFSTQILGDLGYVTTWAANADEALRLLAESPDGFDVVFSDVVMPGMSGVDLGREIRRLYARLPVVLTSGYSHVLAEDGRHGFELLQKPYAAEELSRVLRRLSGRRRPARRT